MMKRGLLWMALLGCAPHGVEAPVPARSEPYQGWPEALFLDAAPASVTLTVVPSAGGRIIGYSHERENILFENPDYLGKTLANTAPERLAQGYIGYNVDLGPELRRIPPHLPLWMGPYDWRADGEAVRLESPLDPAVGIRIHKQIRLDRATGELSLLQTMTNGGASEQAYCLWDRTLCKGGGFALVPLAAKSRFRAKWSLLRNGTYGGEAPEDPRVRLIDGVLVAEARGESAKLGVDSDAGWVAYARGKLLFIKYFPHFPAGVYSDGGNSVEVYFDPRVCELEPLSPQETLRPGQSYAFPERWKLLRLEAEVTGPEQARALVPRIPPSPFRP